MSQPSFPQPPTPLSTKQKITTDYNIYLWYFNLHALGYEQGGQYSTDTECKAGLRLLVTVNGKFLSQVTIIGE